MRFARCLALALGLVFVAAPALAGDDMKAHATPATAASPLDRLKALAGTWSGMAGAGEQKFPVTNRWHVTAAGSAVVETQFVGTPHEMTTVYTVEGGALALTHYCTAGNQPHMKVLADSPANELVFDFAGGAGIDPAKDAHMHRARIVFVDADHVRCEWTMYEGGKSGHVGVMELARQK